MKILFVILQLFSVCLVTFVGSESLPNNANSTAFIALSIPQNTNMEEFHGFGLHVGMARMDPAFGVVDEDGTWYPEDYPNLKANIVIEVWKDGNLVKDWDIAINASSPMNQTVDLCFQDLPTVNRKNVTIWAYYSKVAYDLVQDFMPMELAVVKNENCLEMKVTSTTYSAVWIIFGVLALLVLILGFVFQIRKKISKSRGNGGKVTVSYQNEKPIIKNKSLIIPILPPEDDELHPLTNFPLESTNQITTEGFQNQNKEKKEIEVSDFQENTKSTSDDTPLMKHVPSQCSKIIECTEQVDKEPVEELTNIPKKKPKEINILLLGQTGVGKSTFINGFANYLQYQTLEEAEAYEGLISPVGSQFTITDDVTFEMKTIVTGIEENESQAASEGQSATQNSKEHVFQFEDVLIRLIDTPGIGDTRGIEQDVENFKQILSFISSYNELHGICILLKPNESRLDIMFRFCIQELLSHHKSATANMAFCFTNARNTNYRPGDTMQPLKQLLKKNGLTEDIKIRKEIVYCVDNEAFRYLAAVKNGILFDHQDKALFATSWSRSRATTEDMVKFFKNKTPYKMKKPLSLDEIV